MSDPFCQIQCTVESKTGIAFETKLEDWLVKKAKSHNLCWLLAHADDGVIWGQVGGDGLLTSHQAFEEVHVSPPLDKATVQQVRLFGPNGELYLWRVNDQWQMRTIDEGTGPATAYYDEPYLLWGDGKLEQCEQNEGFILLRQGAEGLRHAPPLPPAPELPLCLVVRHFLDDDPDGQAYVAFSRLVSITSLTRFKEQGGQNESEKS